LKPPPRRKRREGENAFCDFDAPVAAATGAFFVEEMQNEKCIATKKAQRVTKNFVALRAFLWLLDADAD
jgi:hypothetical protein